MVELNIDIIARSKFYLSCYFMIMLEFDITVGTIFQSTLFSSNDIQFRWHFHLLNLHRSYVLLCRDKGFSSPSDDKKHASE